MCRIFGDFMEGFDDFEAYVRNMRQDGSWGDHLTLVAAAHLMMRPIRVITDTTHEESCVIQINPPEMVSDEAWGPPLVIIHYGEHHYEGTEPASLMHHCRGHA